MPKLLIPLIQDPDPDLGREFAERMDGRTSVLPLIHALARETLYCWYKVVQVGEKFEVTAGSSWRKLRIRVEKTALSRQFFNSYVLVWVPGLRRRLVLFDPDEDVSHLPGGIGSPVCGVFCRRGTMERRLGQVSCPQCLEILREHLDETGHSWEAFRVLPYELPRTVKKLELAARRKARALARIPTVYDKLISDYLFEPRPLPEKKAVDPDTIDETEEFQDSRAGKVASASRSGRVFKMSLDERRQELRQRRKEKRSH